MYGIVCRPSYICPYKYAYACTVHIAPSTKTNIPACMHVCMYVICT